MADAIVETTLENGDCVQQDIHAKGFTHQEIAALWHFANALAVIELKCRMRCIGSSYERDVRYA